MKPPKADPVLLTELIEDFKKYWESEGKPDPSSNEYLRLNRVYFYMKGLERGVEVMMEITDDI